MLLARGITIVYYVQKILYYNVEFWDARNT